MSLFLYLTETVTEVIQTVPKRAQAAKYLPMVIRYHTEVVKDWSLLPFTHLRQPVVKITSDRRTLRVRTVFGKTLLGRDGPRVTQVRGERSQG